MPLDANARWFKIDTTHASYNTVESESIDKHLANEPDALLSIRLNKDGDKSLIKVAGAAGWSPDWLDTSVVLQVFDSTDHSDAVDMLATEEWLIPERNLTDEEEQEIWQSRQ